MSQEFEDTSTSEHTELKPIVRKKRKRRKHKRSIWSMLKRGLWWGIAIGVALLSIIFAIVSYNW